MESTAIYDLTTLLTTIASISASFVAILGGFIASKLITISGERASTLEKIHSLSEEITVKTALKESLQYENDESDALDFIDSNFVSLARKVDLDDLYPTLSNSSIKKESLQPFWDNAQEILLQYHSTLQSGTCKTIDEIKKIIIQQHPTPVGFANDFFDVIQRQLNIIQHEQEKKHPSSNSIYDKLAHTVRNQSIAIRQCLCKKSVFLCCIERMCINCVDEQFAIRQRGKFRLAAENCQCL